MGERLGQHFLNNPEIASRIVDILSTGSGERVLEIGPGKGFLTSFLIDSGAQITGIEIDSGLAQHLSLKFRNNRLNIINDDFLKVNLEEYNPRKICGNIPYQIGGKIIEKIVLSEADWEVAVLMLPEAVASRVAAEPGTSGYSSLSVFCQAACRVYMEFKVGKDDFEPPPKIDSAVVRFLKAGPSPSKEFRKVIKAAFSKRRKKIKNSLSMYFSIPVKEIETMLERADINPSSRAQMIDVNKFRLLTEEFVKQRIL
jgi:16S rRNA (adenine1518-N6/adenine1519-N6)-dimethyltransferase